MHSIPYIHLSSSAFKLNSDADLHAVHFKFLNLSFFFFHRVSRDFGCFSTTGSYGGGGGDSYQDISTNFCDVDIRNVYIRSGSIVDAIQIQYRYPDGRLYTAPRRGGGGGDYHHFSVSSGEKIIGVFGTKGKYRSYTTVSRLYFVKKTRSGGVYIYGPYGRSATNYNFVVIGDIKSIYGRSGSLLDSIGFYYDKWGCE